MAKYVVRPKTDKTGEKEKVHYYGVPVSYNQVTVEDMAEKISQQSSLTEEDVISAVSSVAKLMRQQLADGNTVYLRDIGLFTVSASSEGCDTPEECTPAKVKAKRVCFKADNKLRGILPGMKFELEKKKK